MSHEEIVTEWERLPATSGIPEIAVNLATLNENLSSPVSAWDLFNARCLTQDQANAVELLSQFNAGLITKDRYDELIGQNPAEAMFSSMHSLAYPTEGAEPRRVRNIDAMFQLAATFSSCLRCDEAIALLERVLELGPNLTPVRIALLMVQLPIIYRSVGEIDICRAAYSARLARLRADADEGCVLGDFAAAVGSSQPFYLAYQGHNDRELQGQYGALMCRAVANQYPPLPLPESSEKVRVGIVTGLFRHHTVWKLLIKGWLTQLDREKFQIFGYHTADLQDAETGKAANLCDCFIQGPLTTERWREEILADSPHVLLYPEIGMDPGAAHLAAHRLAPVQCAAFGHPNTTGYPTIDYYLSGAMVEAEDADEHYTERLIRLPNLGLYYEPLEIGQAEIDRAQLGLRSEATVYWSGQSLFKYLPQFDAIYPCIAREVENCQFVFIQFGQDDQVTETFRGRLERAFAGFGLNAANHCVFLPRLSTEAFVAAIGQCDVVLDTPAWSGGNSTLESLANDLPIVTWPSALMRGRVTAAILRRVGITETIADTLDDYVVIAVRLARDASWRLSLKQRIAENKHRVYRDREYIEGLESFLCRAAQLGSAVDMMAA